jgi:lambda repressor-like predicted transcriptional regulator
MSSRYVIYRGAAAKEAEISLLYTQGVALHSIAKSIGVSQNYVRAVVLRRGFIHKKSIGPMAKLEKLKILMESGTSMEQMVEQTGYAPNTIRSYKQWLIPESCTHRPPRVKPVEKVHPVTITTSKNSKWPCTLSKSTHKGCFHKRNCQSWLNKVCEV